MPPGLGGPCLSQDSVPPIKCDMMADWGLGRAREALSFLLGLKPAGEHVFGMSACVREVTLKPYCWPALLAAKDCIWPLWWPRLLSVKDLEKKAQSEEKETQNQWQHWHVSWSGQFIAALARLPAGLISLSFFFMVAQLCPMGGLFYTLQGPAFWGDFCTCHAALLGAA